MLEWDAHPVYQLPLCLGCSSAFTSFADVMTLPHISMAVYRFFRASCCKWIGHHIWRLFLVIYVSQWERLTILCVSGTSSSPSSSPALSSNSGRLKAFIMLLALSVTTLTMCLVISGVVFIQHLHIYKIYVTIEHFINETCHNTQKAVSSSVCPYV